MKTIKVHWDVGNGAVNEVVWRHYHFAVTSVPDVKWLENPYHPPEVNKPEGVATGRYLRHTGGGNTGAIGVAVLGMAGTTPHNVRPFDPGPHPITDRQMEVCAKGVAELCMIYGIPVTSDTVQLHCEFDSKRGPLSRGKWDVSVWGTMQEPIDFKRAGDLFRSMVKKYLPTEAEAPDAVGDLIAEAKTAFFTSNTNRAALGSALLGGAGTIADNDYLIAFIIFGIVLMCGYIIWSRERKNARAIAAEAQR